jgi:hypothetical protein
MFETFIQHERIEKLIHKLFNYCHNEDCKFRDIKRIRNLAYACPKKCCKSKDLDLDTAIAWELLYDLSYLYVFPASKNIIARRTPRADFACSVIARHKDKYPALFKLTGDIYHLWKVIEQDYALKYHCAQNSSRR